MSNPNSPAFTAPVVECPDGSTPDPECVLPWANAFQDAACANARLHSADMQQNLDDYIAAVAACDPGDAACLSEALNEFTSANEASVTEHQARSAANVAAFIAIVHQECCK